MSLVPYTSSDVSDSEEENENSNEDFTLNENSCALNRQSNVINNKNLNAEPSDILNNHSGHDDEKLIQTSNGLFQALPTPKDKQIEPISEEFDEFLHKKEVPIPKPTIKITVPTLKDYNDGGEPQIKKFKSSTKSTGLFSVLPPPRSSTIVPLKLVPKTVISQQVKKLIPDKVLKPSINKIVNKCNLTKVPVNIDKGIIEDDVIEGNDFFSLTSDIEQVNEIPQDTLNVTNSSTDLVLTPRIEEPIVIKNDFIPLSIESNESSNDNGLDEEALRALCGARGVKQRRETQILDLHESEVRPASSEWMQQALLKGTDNEPPAPTTALPGGMQRRKHQITFLAQQAKANEQQLKNMWAQNRFTRQQTQSKYGF